MHTHTHTHTCAYRERGGGDFILFNLKHLCFILSQQYEDYIFTTDWTSKAIERYNKHSGSGHTIIQNNIEALMNIHVIAADRQTGNFILSEYYSAIIDSKLYSIILCIHFCTV